MLNTETRGLLDGKRHKVVFALLILSLITYVDRVCISAATGPIAAELGLSDTAMGLVFSAFALLPRFLPDGLRTRRAREWL